MFIQICPNLSGKNGICCRLSDISKEDGERFYLSVAGGGSAEVGLSHDDPERSEQVDFFGLVDGTVYIVNAYKRGDTGWEKAAECKTVPAMLPVRRTSGSEKMSARTAGNIELPPAGVIFGGKSADIIATVEATEVF